MITGWWNPSTAPWCASTWATCISKPSTPIRSRRFIANTSIRISTFTGRVVKPKSRPMPKESSSAFIAAGPRRGTSSGKCPTRPTTCVRATPWSRFCGLRCARPTPSQPSGCKRPNESYSPASSAKHGVLNHRRKPATEAVEMTGRGKRRKPNYGFPPSPQPFEIAPQISTFPPPRLRLDSCKHRAKTQKKGDILTNPAPPPPSGSSLDWNMLPA